MYDAQGRLVGDPGQGGVRRLEVDGLIEYPTAERAGAVFAILTVGAELDVDAWLGDMASALEMLQLEKLHRYDVETKLPSGNWKATADGYLDGYHLGYLHRNSIGVKSITNRNTYDTYGPHVRIGFANKPIAGVPRHAARGMARPVRLLLTRPLHLPQHLDLGHPHERSDGEPVVPGAERGGVHGDPVPVLP